MSGIEEELAAAARQRRDEVRSTVDVDSCSGSGSALVSAPASISQCVPAQPNTVYYVSYRYRSTTNRPGTASCYAAFLPRGNNCTISGSTGTLDATADYTDNSWVSGFAGGSTDSDTTHILYVCRLISDVGHYDQLTLSTVRPSAPGF